MKRSFILLFGVLSYMIFLGTYLYFIAFTGGFSVPKSVDSGTAAVTPSALAINLLLITLFALQHSIMARQGFKRRLMQIIPRAAERSAYVLMSSVLLALLMWQWQPLSLHIWAIDNEIVRAFTHSLFGIGAVVAVASSFMINHGELFGLQQVYQHWRRKSITSPEFQTPWFYKIVRHPIQTGQIIFFWAAPDMTAGRLLLALGMTVYALVGIYFEERDLVRLIGNQYVEYREKVPRLIPLLKDSGVKTTRSEAYSDKYSKW